MDTFLNGLWVTGLCFISSGLTSKLLLHIPNRYLGLPSISINGITLLIAYSGVGGVGLLLGYSSFSILMLFLFLNLALPLFFIDLKTGYLPNILTYSLLWVGLLYQGISLNGNLISAFYALILSYVLLVVMTTIMEKIRKRPQMGRGDFKLIAACSAWLGLLDLPYFLGLSASLGIVHFIALCIKTKGTLVSSIPFGPAIICSAMVWLFFSMSPN
ncbi:prepilin peptidase [Providencia rustigianii]|uniref:prepilin peptidase n=1 Tax=Providencia rustigianii TaxID=158850 RepID=UPI000F6CB710|nr:A24 family peptidase [Providencia rustigianii]MTC61517.1 prepilin peptidase [Providencia rustigianii]VEH54359.1 Pectic enzymes secretion protein outO [Providencia rustigianii]